MIKVFDESAKYYDLLYGDKNYIEECIHIKKIFDTYGSTELRTILDVGCGTGNHALLLAMSGYDVTGIDPSSNMIKRLREKDEDNLITSLVSNAKNFRFKEKSFDVAICMFATLNYIIDIPELINSLMNIRKHLKKGGLFITDFWYGPAVLHIKPSDKIKVRGEGDMMIIRGVEPELDIFNHIQKSHYLFIVFNGNTVINTFEETHVLRFFFPQEITWFLEQAGFKIISFTEFMNLDSPPTEDTWNAMIVAEAV